MIILEPSKISPMETAITRMLGTRYPIDGADGRWAVWAAVPIVFFLNSYFGLAIAALQRMTPNRMRAQVSALMLFMTNLFGLALGPSVVAAITDFVFADDQALGRSLGLLPLVLCPLAAVLRGLGLSYDRRAIVSATAGDE